MTHSVKTTAFRAILLGALASGATLSQAATFQYRTYIPGLNPSSPAPVPAAPAVPAMRTDLTLVLDTVGDPYFDGQVTATANGVLLGNTATTYAIGGSLDYTLGYATFKPTAPFRINLQNNATIPVRVSFEYGCIQVDYAGNTPSLGWDFATNNRIAAVAAGGTAYLTCSYFPDSITNAQWGIPIGLSALNKGLQPIGKYESGWADDYVRIAVPQTPAPNG